LKITGPSEKNFYSFLNEDFAPPDPAEITYVTASLPKMYFKAEMLKDPLQQKHLYKSLPHLLLFSFVK